VTQKQTPRVIALIDLSDLRLQLKRVGGAVGHDLATVVRQLEAGLGRVDAAWSEARLSLGAVYVYSPLEADRPLGDGHMVFRKCGADDGGECSACGKACTHCRASVKDPGRRGHDNPMAVDLFTLAREHAYDWAVVVSTDTWLIPVVKYLQSHGRKIIHGCVPPIAQDLTKECWASIDLGARGSGSWGRRSG